MNAFRCDCCKNYFDNSPSQTVKVIFASGLNHGSIIPDICDECQVKIAKMFPSIKIRDKITKEEL